MAQVAYHAGRLTIYTALGALSGYAGQAFDQTVELGHVQNLTGILVGGSMILWALWSLVRRPTTATAGTASGNASQIVALSGRKPNVSRLGQWLAWLHRLPGTTRGALLGITSALLPCGWLYTFVAASAGQGTPLGGALVMAAFCIGTMPALIGVGSIVGLLGANARRWLPRMSTAVLLVLGLTTIALRRPVLHLDGPHDPSPQHSCH
jgi:sulfite exporter TauE/SafE